MTDHHTPEQVTAAFAHAPSVLAKLREAGVPFPRFELCHDASGVLWVGERKTLTLTQVELASELVFSNRHCFTRPYEVGILFCCGLVTGAEKAKSPGEDFSLSDNGAPLTCITFKYDDGSERVLSPDCVGSLG